MTPEQSAETLQQQAHSQRQEILELKARVLDLTDTKHEMDSAIQAIARKVGFRSGSLPELVNAVPTIEVQDEVINDKSPSVEDAQDLDAQAVDSEVPQ